MQIISLATMSTLPRARALAASLRRHTPDSALTVMLIAREPTVEAVARSEPSLRVASVATELGLDVESLLARHGEEDLTVLLAPHALLHRLERDAEPLMHLPSSAWLLAGLEPIESLLEERGVVLVPRLTGELPDDGLEPSRAQLERAGRIDDTVIAVDAGARAKDFLRWWSAHVQSTLGSLDALAVGARPEDRPWLARFLELAPARFSTGVLADPGSNLGQWNLHEHVLSSDGASGDHVIVDGRGPLRFLNLPGFDPDRPFRLAASASRARVSRSPLLRRLCERYARELREAGWSDADYRHDVGRRLADGLVYDDALRSIYARALALGDGVDDLFGENGTREFLEWLEAPAPRGGSRGINRYLFYRVSRERPDVLRVYPDLNGSDGAGYVRWAWEFGRNELAVPDRFMPPRPASIAAAKRWSQPTPRAAAQASRPRPRRAAPRGADGVAVRLTGYLGHTLGLGAAARGYVEALSAAGVPVRTASVPLHHLAPAVQLSEDYGLHSFEEIVHGARHGFEIVAVNADELPDFVERLGESYFEGPRIGIWGWETNSIPPRWQRAFALIEEIWVYSRFMAENIGAQAPVPVLALPPPVTRPSEPVEPTRLGVPDGFLFLFVFDYLSTVQRKNPVGLIEAFKRAFAPGEGPRLLLKTINAPLRPLSEEEVLWATDGREDIHVIDRSLSPQALSGLMAACDCYVSLHRAEGFGLTIAEAMAMSKPVIATGYSGNVDFMDAENSYLIDYTIGRVGPECEIYPPEGEWAEPSVDHAAELMRRVHRDPQEAARKAARAAADIAERFSPAVTGQRMRERLEQLAGLASPVPAEHQ
ncbi:MAG TPA: glycosyltransferase [Solirubrobacteraceae bacterium]|jgi:glycosyltransferase involved in cell wall biosynthesis|nr:glycosyltransferase [Solirubrobacteraceae bacterium]